MVRQWEIKVPRLRSQTESRYDQTQLNARRGCRAFKFTWSGNKEKRTKVWTWTHERSDERTKVWTWTHESFDERTKVWTWTHESLIMNAGIVWWTHESLDMNMHSQWAVNDELKKDQNFEKPGLGSCPCSTKRSSPFAFLIVWSLSTGWIVYSVSVIPFLLMHFFVALYYYK